jgi:tetratricopeptide (TPR) repeat protein
MRLQLFFACALSFLSAFTLSAQSGATAAGVKYTILQTGNGPSPKAGQELFIHVEALDHAGKTVFSSRDLGLTVHIQLGKETDAVSKAHDELMMQMNKGCKYREEIPKSLLPADDPSRKEAGDYQITIIELVDIMDAKPSGVDLIVATAEKSGIAAAETECKTLQQNNPQGYTFFEWDMNAAGYKALQEKKFDLAIALFTLNTTLYPNSANTYDSLGDGYAEKGDKANAKANYQKAFQMSPKFTASKEKMEKL